MHQFQKIVFVQCTDTATVLRMLDDCQYYSEYITQKMITNISKDLISDENPLAVMIGTIQKRKNKRITFYSFVEENGVLIYSDYFNLDHAFSSVIDMFQALSCPIVTIDHCNDGVNIKLYPSSNQSSSSFEANMKSYKEDGILEFLHNEFDQAIPFCAGVTIDGLNGLVLRLGNNQSKSEKEMKKYLNENAYSVDKYIV